MLTLISELLSDIDLLVSIICLVRSVCALVELETIFLYSSCEIEPALYAFAAAFTCACSSFNAALNCFFCSASSNDFAISASSPSNAPEVSNERSNNVTWSAIL